ncbi:hypothetical protein [Sunxiuqinia elliptica]|uniref:Uncharacterized protein n=1 Tax=Sunxiuqinia elliptica TaxID=655355 RepID=A0A4R6HCB7_9BACT|nr:hypothetical protein [Sunxiuqinia elliptica]TDO05421.1 hypothetical protein DET52_101781 [Sunxiuqinia elliptica]
MIIILLAAKVLKSIIILTTPISASNTRIILTVIISGTRKNTRRNECCSGVILVQVSALTKHARPTDNFTQLLTNKAAKGQKGAVLAMIKGTKSESIIAVLKQLPKSLRNKIEEISRQMV